jgi:hypothetical protein
MASHGEWRGETDTLAHSFHNAGFDLRNDLAQFTVRNQIANVPGASIPQPHGGHYRQIMVYVDPVKLKALPCLPTAFGSEDTKDRSRSVVGS